MRRLALLCLLSLAILFPRWTTGQEAAAGKLSLVARSRVKGDGDKKRDAVTLQPLAWNPRETAVVVCDMWDKHWCPTATARVAEMAPRMNEVIQAARKQGVLIIHCPSDTLNFYKDTPQRKLAQQAPVVPTKIPLENWCRIVPEKEGALPIDDSDGGCDCDPAPKEQRAWSRQIATIEILDGDAITDSAEAFYLMKQRGITNVILLGVHANMCVLGRPFGLRQMAKNGRNVVLMRDMTDTMYNPAKAPFVSHFTGNDYVVEHIEAHWCPTITSTAFLGGTPFRFSQDKRPRIAMIIGEDEYKTEKTLPEFARKHLGQDFQVTYIFDNPQDKHDFPAMSELAQADVALLSVRRRLLTPVQLKVFQDFVAAGKPVVGIRTATHAFSTRDDTIPEGKAAWPLIDLEVFGCDYTNHHSNKNGETNRQFVWPLAESAGHPILKGIGSPEVAMGSTLYNCLPLNPKATVLMLGRWGEKKPHEPVAWTFTRSDGGKSFYTSLGGVEDFQQEVFQTLLKNGLLWAAESSNK
ncbi:MAG: ThuA domain-containing protein [Planctomycetota bacterium]